jgi:NAD(P)-dependent dehydrogenase (short-subunit alcohol dehydrogenase family)
MGRVAGKIILITGAANGIGRAAAELLAEEGATVILTDVDSEAGEQLAEALSGAGRSTEFMLHDVSSESQWKEVMVRVLQHYGRLDVLVNNAGFGTYNDIETVTLEQWRRIMAVNLDGTFIGTQLAIRTMKETGGGAIINISSIGALIGSPSLAAYSASKAGVHLLTKCAAVYCGQKQYNIRVNSVHPGLVDTRSGVEMARLATGLEDDHAAIQAFTSLHPIGRLGKPADIAAGILYLASDESDFMTGSALVLDGGFTAI